MTKEEHKDRHILLHQHLDELVADWISKTEGYPSKSSITDLIQWSYKQTLNPDENWFESSMDESLTEYDFTND